MTENGSEDRDVGQDDGEAHGFDTEFLDDTDDAHATMFGFWKGYRGLGTEMEYSESKKNPHYFYFGYVFGSLVRRV